MKKNAFTLIELLAVITILSIVAMITYPLVTSVINDSKKKACQEQINTIENAANRWFTDKLAANPTFTATSVTISKLYTDGYLKTYPVQNPMYKNKEIPGTTSINIQEKQNQYVFTLNNKANICK